MKEPTLKDWGKFKIRNTTMRISAAVEPDEWQRFARFAAKNGTTMADLIRAGVRKLLEEAKVEQPRPTNR